MRESQKGGKSTGEIGPSERFIGSNEDVGGVQVGVLCLRPVSIMEPASQLAIDRAAHDLVLPLFFTIPVCQAATEGREHEEESSAARRIQCPDAFSLPKRWSEVRRATRRLRLRPHIQPV